MLSNLSFNNKCSFLAISLLSLSMIVGCNNKQTASTDDADSGKNDATNKQPEDKNPEDKNADAKENGSSDTKLPGKTVEENMQDALDKANKEKETKKPDGKNEDKADDKKNETPVKTDDKKDENKKDNKNTETKNTETKNTDSKNTETKPTKKGTAKDDPSKGYKLAKGYRYNPQPSDTLEELKFLLRSMVGRPHAEQQRSDFLAALLETVGKILESKDATDYDRNYAKLSRFKILHLAGLAGDKKADFLLVKYAKEATGKESRKVTAWVNLAKLEQRFANADKLKVEELPKMLSELKTYLSDEKLELDDKYLRLAGYSTAVINRLDKKKQDALFKEFGKLYATSYELDLKTYGLQLGNPPKVEGGKLIGQEMKLVAKLAPNDDRFDMKDHRGKVMIVDFWATWCGPCIGEIPNVKKILDKYVDKNFDVIGVSLDRNEDKLKDYLKTNPLPWNTVYSQLAQQAATTYGVRGIPSFFLVDKYGKIVAQSNRVSAFEGKIEALLEVEYKIENDTSITKPEVKPVEKPADSEKKPEVKPAK